MKNLDLRQLANTLLKDGKLSKRQLMKQTGCGFQTIRSYIDGDTIDRRDVLGRIQAVLLPYLTSLTPPLEKPVESSVETSITMKLDAEYQKCSLTHDLLNQQSKDIYNTVADVTSSLIDKKNSSAFAGFQIPDFK
jgi:hypothetical protein